MKFIKSLIKTASLVTLLSAGISLNAHAQNYYSDSPVFSAAVASGASVYAVGKGLSTVGKTALSVVAVPLIGVGKVGELSGEAGHALLDASGVSFEIGEAALTATRTPRKQIVGEGE
ncbi:MAG: hypothetical protein KTR18_08160 [Acidiferrobacterales bacterium]|nr:hypothetical protein [Acidiferrobacterales bacterium]